METSNNFRFSTFFVALFILLGNFQLQGQTLINANIVATETNFGSNIYKPDGIYFNATTDGAIPNGVYYLHVDESLLLIQEGSRIQFEHNGNLILKNSVDHELYVADLSTNTSTILFSNSDFLLISQRVIEYNDLYYFVGYDLTQNIYAMMTIDQNGVLSIITQFTGPVQNTNRLHEEGGIFYFFTNTLTPSAQHYYSFDPNSGAINTINSQEYGDHPYPYFNDDLTSVNANGTNYTLNNNSQLSTSPNGSDLTCFELIGGEGPSVPTILGNINEKVYLFLNNNQGSSNGLYRYPQDADNGLCQIDCMDDTTQPICGVGPFTVQLDPGQNYYTFDINDFATDDCDSDLIYENAELDQSTPNGTSTFFFPGTDDQFPCGTYEVIDAFAFNDAGLFSPCSFTFTVECESDSCDNVVLHFDGINDKILSDSPLSGNSEYTISLDFRGGSQTDGTYPRLISFSGFETEIGVKNTDISYYNSSTWIDIVGANVADNLWHNVSLTRDNSMMHLYLDGSLISSTASPLNLNFDGSMAIAGKTSGGSEFYGGAIDNVKVWDYALSEVEICSALQNPVSSNSLDYNFQEGQGEADNSSILEVADQSGNGINGTMVDFSLTGSASNFLCESISISSDSCFELPPGCDLVCQADQVDLSTGIDFLDNSFLPVGEYDGGWVMISGPDNTLNYPQPGFVLTPNGAWSDELNAQFISPFANTSNNMTFPEPYTFERQFCICEATTIKLDILALFDNFLEVGLYDSNGTLIQQLINVQSNSVDNFQEPTPSNTTHQLSPGTYSLRAGLRNDMQVSMGFAIEAIISGVGLIESGCCSPFQYITGTIVNDIDCDSLFNFNTDTAIPDVLVSLCDLNNQVIQESTSDAFGFYTFFDVEPGEYIVKQTVIDDLESTLGNGGYTVSVEPNTVLSNIDFGYCFDPCQDDLEAPVVSCPTNTAYIFNLNNGIYAPSISDFDITATDDCKLAYTFSPSQFDCNNLGVNQVNVLISDEAGNTASCDISFTLLDTNMECECCETEDELTNAVLNGFSTNNLLCNDDNSISITPLTTLFDCQSASRIYWGDGQVDELSGTEFPSHVYQSNGVYLISIEVVSTTAINDTCQVDYADLTIIHKNCDVTNVISTIDDQIFTVYPIPASNILNVEVSKNQNGYSSTIINTSGQLISSFEIPANQSAYQFDSELLESGVYFLMLEDKLSGLLLETRFIKI